MIKTFKAENYKSIKSLELELGRVNVFIGENGAGKSNILELFALAGAAVADKLDNEFLASRGIRVTEPKFMRPAFSNLVLKSCVSISISTVSNEAESLVVRLTHDDLPYSQWEAEIVQGINITTLFEVVEIFKEYIVKKKPENLIRNEVEFKEFKRLADEASILWDQLSQTADVNPINSQVQINRKSNFCRFIDQNHVNVLGQLEVGSFLIFSPEYSALRNFYREGQIEPLGIKGEGLLKLLSVLSKDNNGETLQEIKSSLQVLGWFEDFKLVDGDTFSSSRIAIKDRYIEDETRWFDQMSANEGFLFLLFYFALFSTKLTPSIFAIDNIDASLNPALCEKLLSELVRLAKKHDKQVLLTTHNPATLDGLNLDDDEQRLFVVSRGRSGETRVRRIQKKASPSDNQRPVRLSEMFLRGSLGGIPKGF